MATVYQWGWPIPTLPAMKIKAAAIEASARNDYASNMICIMHSDGYKVSPLATDYAANDFGKELRKEARDIVWEQTLDSAPQYRDTRRIRA
ncbi:hypothetical protein AB3H54_28385 [Escherichia coli]|uniref:hypothetical protein n=1 Tax=Escherichia coli TaxID=562 RepID=UPI0034658246